MATESENGEYSITWKTKPLGFSIVMDTTGRNAYVSSIQKQENLRRGLKLAAQIIRVNDDDAKQKKHGKILELIKNASLPMTLTFQPRSFATGAGENNEPKDNATPVNLLIGNAPQSAKYRVDGIFILCKSKTNDRHMWQRDDEEEDPIILWFWPTEISGLEQPLWMIGRKSKINKQSAYACCPSDKENPLDITKKWKVWVQERQTFEECSLSLLDKAVDIDSKSIQ